jgi:hypothetical protein
MKDVKIEFVKEVLDLIKRYKLEMGSQVHLETGGEYAPMTFFINCTNVFKKDDKFDSEEITNKNINILEDYLKESKDINESLRLFCIKMRNV